MDPGLNLRIEARFGVSRGDWNPVIPSLETA